MIIKGKQGLKFQVIRETTARDNNLLRIEWLCEIAGVSRSGYYRWLKAEPTRSACEERDKVDFNLILAAYKYRGYDKGTRGIHMRLLRQNPPVTMNVKKIRRLMNKFGLVCPIRQANPYRRMLKAMHTNKVADNLVNREFRTHGARKILLTDITYIRRKDGRFSYLSTIIDAYTRQVLAHALSDSLEVDFVLETVNTLVELHGASLCTKTLIHSDQGSHYTSNAFMDILSDSELRQSMSRRANCWDNAPQESFFGHMKDEIDVSECLTHKHICAIVNDWIDYYNNDRYQWDLAKLSPNEFFGYVSTSVYPIGGAAPEPPEFIAIVSKEGNEKGGT
jgi:transposase InsO family protein